ncbi:hypothetical protein KHC33_04260 [Methanospirillum sp. J.3.6.1-F.2.7.3]|uniref:Uncharacterized protein n=1 Tax=Methanospirillum purgamenti TaxID=2834276 RepID=A0A8E7B0J4_9EURY|nr:MULTISPECIES: hypothetical protein [Methanospirillum]MDX8551907.1 hypothetical protein [Methanospirillum hungatei]QVV89734.1 hypothetical protein KHC33_04260 [Methanospirillum sp. J.3.6.1-F.2.7.3]
MLDYGELQQMALEGDNEALETNLNELKHSDLSILPEGISLLIFESNFPETILFREGYVIIADITEHIYSKYWWHKYHARVFVDAMERAVTRLQIEGNPLSDPTIESDEDVHIFFRFKLTLPKTTPSEQIIESINSAFDLVWERANAILENSDSVLILGKDTDEGLEKLKKISSELQHLGYYTYIIKEQPDRIGESIIQKVLRFALSSKFVIIENSEPSGHLYEIPHVTKMAELVTVVLQEESKGATWMFEDSYVKHSHWKKFSYKPDNMQNEIENAISWAENYIKEFGQFQKEKLPWLR